MTGELVTKCYACCAHDVVFLPGKATARCPGCDRINNRPKSSQDEQILKKLKYANERRNMGEFAEAEKAYREVLADYENELEARWGLLLCKYGVMYVESADGKERVITCRKSLRTSFRSEPDYLLALQSATEEVYASYEKDAEEIDRIQVRIRELRRTFTPYDVFLCYKQTDNGKPTEDSRNVQRIYNMLLKEKYKPFFADDTLNGLSGADYEANIFLAIESAPTMIVYSSKKEYFNTPWVRSEWTRFLEQYAQDAKRRLIPVIKGLTEDDLPEEMRNLHLQALKQDSPTFAKDLLNSLRRGTPVSNKWWFVFIIVLLLAVMVAGVYFSGILPINPTPVIEPTPLPAFSSIQLGSQNDTVRLLQDHLMRLGFFPRGVKRTLNTFDDATQQAILLFCEQNNIVYSGGEVDAVLIEYILSSEQQYASPTPLLTPSPTSTPAPTAITYTTLSEGTESEAVRTLQQRLKELGYFSGEIDGYYGAKTKQAVEIFQKYNGLTMDGVAGKVTQRVMYESSNIVSCPTATPAPSSTPKPTATSQVPVNKGDIISFGSNCSVVSRMMS